MSKTRLYTIDIQLFYRFVDLGFPLFPLVSPDKIRTVKLNAGGVTIVLQSLK